MRLQGKVALITGGATGIGRAAALRFAREGAAVAIADVNEADGSATVDLVRAVGAEALFVWCDVTAEDAVRASVQAVREALGALHLLVTAAGILQGAYRQVDELELDVFARVLDVNVLGTFLCCKHAAPVIEESGGGVVLCVSSGGGVRGPSSSLAYGASKAAVHGYCYTLERQLAPRGIRVNVVCPGSIDTAMKRQNIADGAAARGEDPADALAAVSLGDPDGVAKVLAFLASEDADYLTGTVFTR
jgi:NAD(P)-dependent dehydrogenase (short-subunit alcohol dehydrogenase family)